MVFYVYTPSPHRAMVLRLSSVHGIASVCIVVVVIVVIVVDSQQPILHALRGRAAQVRGVATPVRDEVA